MSQKVPLQTEHGIVYVDPAQLPLGLECPPHENMVRPEFAEELTVERMLQRFSGGVPIYGRQPEYGEYDTTMELQRALAIQEDAREAWRRLPAELKAKYPTPQALLQGLADGSLERVQAAAAAAKAAAAGASPSDSAAGGGSTPSEPPKGP